MGILYLILSIVLSLLCLSFIVFTQTSSSSSLMTTYSEHRWETFSNDERTKYESSHDCIGYDECTEEIRDDLEKDSKLINLVCILVVCIQMIMVSIGCILSSKLSKNKLKKSD